MVPPLLFTVLCTWGELENEVLVLGLGGGVFLSGWLLRLWSQVHVKYRLRVRKVLTTGGPYACVRNPIYIGNMLIFLGFTMMAELFWFLPIVLLYCVIVYSLVVRYEESHLSRKYGGAYREYLSRVPRWLPRLPYRWQVPAAENRSLLFPSLASEVHVFVLLLPAIAKDLLV